MDIKLASEHLIFPKNLSLQQASKHSLAKIFWGEFVLENIIYDSEFSIPITELITHGKEVFNNVSRVLSTYLPEKLMEGMLHAVIDLQEGYRQAIFWEEMYQHALPFTILNRRIAGPYAAEYFIIPGGHFDDLSWAKMFVSDGNQCIQKRFQLACFYCFEDELLHLWCTMKANGQLPCKGKLDQVEMKFGYLVELWVYRLENKISELMRENDTFLTRGFREAFDGHFEYAARFFWTRCSDAERSRCLNEINLFILSRAAAKNYPSFVHFIYSLLPVEKRHSLIARSLQDCNSVAVTITEYFPEVPYIWCCLLHSQFWGPVLEDILNFPYPIPSYILLTVLLLLFHDLGQFRIPVHKTIVKVILNKFSHLLYNVVLHNETIYIIKKLAYMNAIDLLETIIQPLARSVKERLLKKYPHVAIAPIFEFSNADNYDAVRRYLISFLIDRTQVNHKLKLRIDASKVLSYITEQEIFKHRMKEASEPKKNEVRKVIESIQGGIQVLDHLLGKSQEMEVICTKFLDFDLKLCD